MNKNTFTTVKLDKGEMNIYDFGTIKLHAYKTNDFIGTMRFLSLKKTAKLLLLNPLVSLTTVKNLRSI